jgi:hypothetical protein
MTSVSFPHADAHVISVKKWRNNGSAHGARCDSVSRGGSVAVAAAPKRD